jgi:predicted ATPase
VRARLRCICAVGSEGVRHERADHTITALPGDGRAGPLATVAGFLDGEERSDSVPFPKVLLISGEAGIGKSRLVSDARAMADQTGRRSVIASCFETDRALPYAFARDLLRALSEAQWL